MASAWVHAVHSVCTAISHIGKGYGMDFHKGSIWDGMVLVVGGLVGSSSGSRIYVVRSGDLVVW